MRSAHFVISALALAGAALASPAAAHGSCDVIPWNPIHELDNSVSGLGQAQCFPETHSNWDITTCLQYRQNPVGAYETIICKHESSTVTANGIQAQASTRNMEQRCRTGWWRTEVTAVIGQHSVVRNESPDVLVVCRVNI